MTDDVAYTQKLSRHRNVMQIDDVRPQIDFSFVATNSTLAGEVFISPYASVWYNATLRGDVNPIRLGSYSSIGDSCALFTACSLPVGVPSSITIGKHVIIEEKCSIYPSIIDNNVFIGANSIIGEGTRIEQGAMIAPNSYVPHGRLIPGKQLWGGNPIKYIRDLSEEEIYAVYMQSYDIWNLAQKHLNGFNFSKNSENDEVRIDPESLMSKYLSDNYFQWRAKYYY
jgi:carbonic anhydrase/acetyltransferase-like protein (isoleucine patch superfamily)